MWLWTYILKWYIIFLHYYDLINVIITFFYIHVLSNPSVTVVIVTLFYTTCVREFLQILTCRRLPLNSTSYKLPLGARYVMDRARRMTNVYSQMAVRQMSAVTAAAVASRRQTTSCILSRVLALLHVSMALCVFLTTMEPLNHVTW